MSTDIICEESPFTPVIEENLKKYHVRGMVEVAQTKIQPPKIIWNNLALIPNSVAEFVGPPSIGKSRIVASLAKCQILGRDFAGLPTCKTPLRWLFMGTENGMHRINNEGCQYLCGVKGELTLDWTPEQFQEAASKQGFSASDLKQLDDNFRTFTLEAPEDYDIRLNDPKNIGKLEATLSDERPDILVCDPWGDLIAGDELNDGDVRNTICILRQCFANTHLQCFTIFINHSRMGKAESLKAIGCDAGNYGKNSKCLFSISRCVFNLRNAIADPTAVEIICAKNNEAALPPSIAVRLNPQTMSYDKVENFKPTGNNAEASIQSSLSRKQKTINELKKTVLDIICKAGLENPYSRKCLLEALQDRRFAKSSIEHYLQKAVQDGVLCCLPYFVKGDNGKPKRVRNQKVYLTPDLATRYMSVNHYTQCT